MRPHCNCGVGAVGKATAATVAVGRVNDGDGLDLWVGQERKDEQEDRGSEQHHPDNGWRRGVGQRMDEQQELV